MSHEATPNEADHSAPAPVFDATSKAASFLIAAIAVIAGLVMGWVNPFMSKSASSQGTMIDTLFSIVLGITTVVFVIVQGFLIYSIVRFGRQPGDDEDGPPIRGNTKLEIIWTAVPAITIVIIGLLSYRVLADIERPQPGERLIEVKAFQYAWQFYYPEADVTATELHVALDEPVLLKMRSNDVIHSFWVPAFRIKKDVMPDRVTEARITGTELGTYPIVCAELCGAGHAVMRSQVVVQSDADFKAWLATAAAAKKAPQPAATADPIAYGRQLFTQYACDACHTLDDANAHGQIGPNLNGIGSRAANRVSGQPAEAYLRTSILKPGEYIVEGYPDAMPKDYGLRMSDAEVHALVTYLLGQK